MGGIVGDGVAPWQEAIVGHEEVAVAGPQLDLDAVTNGIPLDGVVEADIGFGLEEEG